MARCRTAAASVQPKASDSSMACCSRSQPWRFPSASNSIIARVPAGGPCRSRKLCHKRSKLSGQRPRSRHCCRDSIPPVRPACVPARRDNAPDRAPVDDGSSCVRAAPRTPAPAKPRHRLAATSLAGVPGFRGVEYQFVRTFTQPLPSTTGKLVSANSNPSAGNGSRCSRSIRMASPTVCGLPVIRRCSSAPQPSSKS